MMTDTNTTRYIEFRVYDEDRFAVFMRFFMAFKTRPTTPPPEPVNLDVTQRGRSYSTPEEWLLVLRPPDMKTMGMPDHKTALLALRGWQGLSRSERRAAINKDPVLQMLADFADMVKQISRIHFRPISLEKIGKDTARLEIETDEIFFTERDELETILLFFGFVNVVGEQL
jgi:hypothetical protein